MQVTIVLPTLNEHENIKLLLSRLKKVLKPFKNYEVIVVDDNSNDGTWQYVKSYSQKNKMFKLLRRIKKKGLSSAIKDGIRHAKGKYIIVMDADLQHNEKIIPTMINKIKNYDLVVASRKTKKGWFKEVKNHATLRSFIALLIIKLFLDVKLNDPLSGYFAIRKSIFDKTDKYLKPKGFKFLLEFYVKANPKQVAEISYVFKSRRRGKSKQNLFIALSFLRLVMELFIYKMKNKTRV